MTHITGVAEAALYVENIDRAARFYTQVLGLLETARFDSACFLQTGPNSTLILFNTAAIASRDSVIPAHGAVGEEHVALAIPTGQYDAWRDRLSAHGVTIEHEQTWSQGTRSIYFRDPDHNSVELIENTHYPLVWERFNG